MKKTLLTLCLSLCFFNFINAQCTVVDSWSVTPQPVNGTYSPGTVVNFCYTVSSFDQESSNWFHGVTLKMGNGWDTSTLTVVSLPNSCDGLGEWDFFQKDSATGSGLVFGAGFYYDNFDGDPGNNFGDNNSLGYCEWTFCFSIQSNSDCISGVDTLDMSVIVTGDGVTGSWGTPCSDGKHVADLVTATCGEPCGLTIEANGYNPPCYGETGSASVNVISSSGPVTYSWSPGGQATDSVSGLDAGIYVVTATDSSGCSRQDSVTISVPSQVVADAGLDSLLCAGVSYTLGGNPTASGGTPPYTYVWVGYPYVDPNPVITATDSTAYSVIVTDANGCWGGDTVNLYVSICENISPVQASSFSLQPNPNDGHFTITLNTSFIQNGTLTIYDVVGRIVYRQTLTAGQFDLDLSSLTNGFYQAQIQSKDFSAVKKFLKE